MKRKKLVPEKLLPENLARVTRQHHVEVTTVTALLDQHGADPDVVDALMHLATVKFQRVNRWGAKAEYERAIVDVLEGGGNSM